METTANSACPTDERLAELIENRLSGALRPELERHVSRCAACADVVATTATVALPPAGAGYGRLYATEPASITTRKRWPRMAVAAALAIAATAALGYSATSRLMRRGAAAIATRATTRLGVPVAIETLTVALQPNLRGALLRLGTVRIGAPDASSPPDSAEAVELAVSLGSLWRGEPQVGLVRLLRPVLYVVAPLEGTAQPSPFAALAATLARTPVELVDGVLHVEVSAGAVLTLDHANGRSTPEADATRVDVTASLNGGSVQAGASVREHAGRVVIRARGLPAAALPYIRDRLRGNVDVDLLVRAGAGTPAVNGRALARAGSVAGGNPLRALVAPAGAVTALEMLPALSGADLAFDELRLSFGIRGPHWRIPGLAITTPDLSVAAGLRGRWRGLTGTGSLRVGAVAAGRLLERTPALASQLETDGSLILPFTIAGTTEAPVFTPRF